MCLCLAISFECLSSCAHFLRFPWDVLAHLLIYFDSSPPQLLLLLSSSSSAPQLLLRNSFHPGPRWATTNVERPVLRLWSPGGAWMGEAAPQYAREHHSCSFSSSAPRPQLLLHSSFHPGPRRATTNAERACCIHLWEPRTQNGRSAFIFGLSLIHI